GAPAWDRAQEPRRRLVHCRVPGVEQPVELDGPANVVLDAGPECPSDPPQPGWIDVLESPRLHACDQCPRHRARFCELLLRPSLALSQSPDHGSDSQVVHGCILKTGTYLAITGDDKA